MIKLKTLVPEGMTGWDRWVQSDMAADKRAELEGIYKRNKGNQETLKTTFDIWLQKIVVEPYGTEYDLSGWHAIALISKDPLFARVVKESGFNVKGLMSKALRQVHKELRQPNISNDWRKGLGNFVRLLKQWV